MQTSLVFKWRRILMLGALVMVFSAGTALGAGFALVEQSVSDLGDAYAGGAAAANDASTIFYNPAGMVRLQNPQIVAGTHLVICYANFRDEGSTHATGAPLTGDDDGNGADTKAVPNFYYARKLSDKFSIGLGVNSPFGLSTQYDDNWVGRYHAIKSDVMTININPSIAYRITDKLSAGAGVSAQYLKAELSNAIDFGMVGFVFGIPGLLPQRNDGFVELEGDSWGIGYNFGLLYEFNEATRIGLAYRSKVEHTLEGDADFSGVPAPLGASFRDTDVEADITLPESFSVSLYHKFNPKWAVMADWTWTNWRRFDELRAEFESGQPDSVTEEEWQDSYRYSLGLNYMPDDKWTFRAGTAYDTTAIPDAEHRTPRVPCSDRIWAALGFGYRISDIVAFDMGYAHLFVNDPEINKSATGEDQLRGGLRGTYEAHIDIVSAQLTMTF